MSFEPSSPSHGLVSFAGHRKKPPLLELASGKDDNLRLCDFDHLCDQDIPWMEIPLLRY
jgi:hypothetical protein